MSTTATVANPRRTGAVALAWGFAEATLFFVVPDVWISRVALRSRRDALHASAWAVAGALAGGALVYLLARGYAGGVLAVFDRLPAIGTSLIARVAGELRTHGAWSVMIGPFTGAPYKLYAAQAPAAGVALASLLAISLPARGLRFVLVALLSSAIAHRATPRFGATRVRTAWLAGWLLFYALYWTTMPT